MSDDQPGAGLPLVGRTSEWEGLVDALAAALGGRCRTVLIEGEGGIGKSRLVAELIVEAQRSGFRVLAGRADEFERQRPFAAVADALAEEGPAAPITALLRDTAGASDELVLIDAFVDHVEALAIAGPVAVVLEDLHWADPSTIAALRVLGRRLRYLPILIVGTYRPHPVPSQLPSLVEIVVREGGTVFPLGRLSDEDAADLAAEMLGADLGPALIGSIAAAAGNPLFVTELVGALQDEGAIRCTDGVAETASRTLPVTLRTTILRRLGFLPPETIDALRMASVLGSTFTVDELAAAVGRTRRDLAAELEPAIRSHVLEDRGPRLGFRHDILQEAVYEDIPTAVRAAMHIEAAKALRSLAVSPVRVGEHLLRGTHTAAPDVVDAVATTAREVVTSAPSLAIALHERMIDVIGPGDARLDDLRIQMLRPLAEVGRAAEAIALADELLKGDHDPVTEGRIRVTRYQTMQRIEGRMIETIPGLQDLVADERLPPPLLRRAKRALAAAYMLSGHADPARSLAEALLPEARKARDNESVIGALSVLGAVNVVTGNIADATAQLGEVVELETREPSNAPHPHAQFASALMLADRFAEARQTLAAGRRRDAEMGRSSSLASYASVAAMIGFFEGTWDDAFAEAETAIDLIGQRVGSALMSMCAHCCLIQVALRRGQLDRAERFLADAEDAVVRVGPSLLVEFIAWSRALYQEVCGDLEAASGAARNAWQMRAGGRRPIGWRWMAGDVVRLALATGDREAAAEVADAAAEAAANAPDIPSMQGTALLCRGLLDDDPDLLVAAAEAYARAPGRVEHAWASEHAAVALARHGRTAEARRSFAAALAAYDDVGATHDAARCTAAARAAGIRRGSRATRQRPVVGWAALTDKEREVARMAAGGLTNPQIAERLFVSKYTVMTHLSHVFAKLGISSRVELAAVAGRESS